MLDQNLGRVPGVPEELCDDDPGGLLPSHLNISEKFAGTGMGICQNNLPPHTWRRGQVFSHFQKFKCLFYLLSGQVTRFVRWPVECCHLLETF